MVENDTLAALGAVGVIVGIVALAILLALMSWFAVDYLVDFLGFPVEGRYPFQVISSLLLLGIMLRLYTGKVKKNG